MNCRGQFSVIAALLVAVVLVGAVMTAYSAIRYGSPVEQPQILSAIDETNVGIREILGFTVGYYGSVLKVTGNMSYAKELATKYLDSGLTNLGDVRPEWGAVFSRTNLTLNASWFSNNSYSQGSVYVNYNLTGMGIYGVNYNDSTSLNVQILDAPSADKTQLVIQRDGSQPLINLGRDNLKFYSYDYDASTWNLAEPKSIASYANGTYILEIPPGVISNAYVIEVSDTRGLMVLAASFTQLTSTLTWDTSPFRTDLHYVENENSAVGIHSNFEAQKNGPDGVYDTITEAAHGVVAQPCYPSSWIGLGSTIRRSGAVTDLQSNNGVYMSFRAYASQINQYTAQIEFTGTSNTPFPWTDLAWAITGSASATDVAVVFQLYNWTSGRYADSGEGYMTATWGTADLESTQTIVNSTSFLNSNKYWKLLVNATKATSTAFDLNLDFVRYAPEIPNYALDLREQWLTVDPSYPRQALCIKTGALGAEPLFVEVWHQNSWVHLMTLAPNCFNNVSLTPYIESAELAIRFKGSNDDTYTDTVQDSYLIDCVYLKDEPDIAFLISRQQSTITLEVLQNGTIRWLGQEMQSTTQTIPVPPLPVKAIHVNQTINGVNQEVPFQIEDWASSYQVPLGLTSSATVFSSRQMIVFLINSEVSDFTVWWDGNDNATQTPMAFTNSYFTKDDIGASKITNGNITLQFSGGTVTSTVAGSTTSSTAAFMRMNQEASSSGPSYVIDHGIVRDIVQQEAEWSGGISNTLYVDSFDGTNRQWDQTGSSPYLNDNDDNRISTNRNSRLEGWFGFQDLPGSSFAGVRIEFECNDAGGDDYFQFQVTDGVSTYGWFNVGGLPFSYGRVSYDLSSIITSVDQLNNLKVNIRYVQVGGQTSTVTIRRCSLDVVTVPNVYANIVITLPANCSYYTFQSRLIFVSSIQQRSITDLCPLKLTSSVNSPQTQTENGTLAGFPIVDGGYATFQNTAGGGWTAHHFTQLISGTKGAGILFTGQTNQRLYAFDSFPASTSRGSLKAGASALELLPVSSGQVQFKHAYDITWAGAVATFDGSTPVCGFYDGTTPMGLWILAEYPPALTVTAKR